jgi:hypothetical protein
MRILIFTLCRRFGYCAFEKLFASEASGPQKTQISHIFPEIPTFLEKIPHFQGPSHIPTFFSKFWLDTLNEVNILPAITEAFLTDVSIEHI